MARSVAGVEAGALEGLSVVGVTTTFRSLDTEMASVGGREALLAAATEGATVVGVRSVEPTEDAEVGEVALMVGNLAEEGTLVIVVACSNRVGYAAQKIIGDEIVLTS